MVHAEKKYEARLLDEENAWGKPTEEQEKIVAMTAEMNSLKKERRGTTAKKDKDKPVSKKLATKNTPTKKMKDQKKKASDKWAWKGKPPKDTESKKTTLSTRLSKARNIFGVYTTTTGQACGQYIIPMTVKWARRPQVPQPTPT